MNIEITINNALQGVGVVAILYAAIRLFKFFAEMYRDVRCNDNSIDFLESRVEKLHQKVGMTKDEAWDWSENGKDVKGTGIVGEVETLKEQMQEISRKVAQLHTS